MQHATSRRSFSSRAGMEASPPLTPSQARGRLQKLKVRLGELGRELHAVDRLSRDVLRLIIELHEAKAWLAFGLKTWEALVEAEGLRMPRLSATDEVAAVRELLENHFSQYAVMSVLGVSQSTLSRRKTALVAEGVIFPAEVRSLDGKTRRVAREKVVPVLDVLPGQLVLPLPCEGPAVADGDSVDAFLRSLEVSAPNPGVAFVVALAAVQDDFEAAVEKIEASAASAADVTEQDRAGIRRRVGDFDGLLRRVKEAAMNVGVAL